MKSTGLGLEDRQQFRTVAGNHIKFARSEWSQIWITPQIDHLDNLITLACVKDEQLIVSMHFVVSGTSNLIRES